MNKEPNKKKKKTSMDGDTITVLAIIGSIVVVGVLLGIFTSTDGGNRLSGSGMGNQASADDKIATLKIILVSVFVSVFFICLFILKKIRDRRRREREKQLEKIRKLQELEAAKERVRQSKRNAFLQAGQNELEKRRKEEALLRNRRQYPDRGRNGYVRRDLNQFKDDGDLEYKEEEQEKFFLRIWHIICGWFHRDREDDKEDE